MYTEIDLIKMNRIVLEIRQSEERLMREYYELADVIASLKRIEEEGIRISCEKLAVQKNNLYTTIRKLQALRSTLEKIIKLYQKCETAIAEYDASGFMKLEATITPAFMNLHQLVGALNAANIRFE